MSARRLVLTADDFGYDPASAELVLDLLEEGAVTATTAIAASSCLPGLAGRLADAAPQGCGVHVVTNSDAGREPWPPLSEEAARTLALAGADDPAHAPDPARAPDSARTPGPAALGPAAPGAAASGPAASGPAASGPASPGHPAPGGVAGPVLVPGPVLVDDPVEAERLFPATVAAAEMAAQLRRLRDLGIRPARIDSHCGTMYGLHGGGFLAEAIGLCAREGLGLRMPRTLGGFLGQDVPAALLDLHARAVGAADAAGVRLPRTIVTSTAPSSRIPGYEALRAEYLALLAGLPEGTSEMFLHPGADTAWARERFGRDWDKRVWEARLLRDPLWRSALEREEIEMVAAW